MCKHFIYKVVNKINGKIYIGKTNNFKKRKQEHTVYDINDNSYFHKALKKYGLDSFEWSIIDYAHTLTEINNLEKYYISEYNTYKPNGYNMTKGGDGGSMWNARPVVCLELDGTYVAKYDSAGETKTDGFRDSGVLICCKNPKRTHKGKIFMFLDEYLKTGARKYIKEESVCMKSIIQCDLNGNFIAKFKSVKEASEKTGILRTRISSVLIKDTKTAGGYIFVYEEDFPIRDISAYKRNKKGRRIAQIDVETDKVVNTFDRIADAGRYLGVNYKAIHKVLDKQGRTAYGYKWASQYDNTEVNK